MALGTEQIAENSSEYLVRQTRRKISIRILPFLFLLFIINYLDRTSVAYAAIGMARDLGFSDRVFALGIGVFFISYLALQIPGALLVERWSARRMIFATMITWGSLTSLTALVHTPIQLYGARFLLGVAEAGFFPGAIVYLSHWFIREDRAKATGQLMAAVPLSLIIGSPVAGWLLGRHWFQIEGWRWLFVLEGLPAVLFGFVAWFYLTDRPRDANWLTAEQSNWITRELQNEKRTRQRGAKISEAFRSPTVVMLAFVGFLAYISTYAAIFWLPTLLKRQSGLSDAKIGLLLAIPFTVSLIGMVINGWHSDKHLERRWHAVIPLIVSALGTLGLITLHASTTMTVVLFSVVCLQLAYLSPFWAIPTEVLSESAAATAVGVMSGIANLSGFLGPVLFGYLRTRTGSHTSGFVLMLISTVAAGILMLFIPGIGVRHARLEEVNSTGSN